MAATGSYRQRVREILAARYGADMVTDEMVTAVIEARQAEVKR